MKITRENYEQYFIDYLDGNLSDQEIVRLENFLLLNPGFRNELEGLQRIILTPNNKPYPGKEFLRQIDLSLPLNEDNFDDFCIAALEGDLNENLNRNFQNYLEIHPEKLNEYLIYNQIHLDPDKNIVFPLKNELKKSVVFLSRKTIYPFIAIAATLALFFIIVKQSGEFAGKYENKPTANLPIKTDSPQINPQISNQVNENIKTVKKQIPVNRTPTPQQITKIPVQNENSQEESMTSTNEIKPEETYKQDLLHKINIPILSENDVIIPRTIQDIQPRETQINATSGKYLSLVEYARKELNEKVLNKKENNLSRVSLLDIAGAGIKGINLLTGSKMKLEKKTTTKGEPDILAFESKLFSFSTHVNPKE